MKFTPNGARVLEFAAPALGVYTTPPGSACVVPATPPLAIRMLGEDKLWMREPLQPQAWISAEQPCDLRAWA